MVACLPITGMMGGLIYLGLYNKTSNWAWRAGLMADIAGPAIALLILPFAPESIRWLVAEGRADEAFEVLVKIRQRTRNDPKILAEFQQIKQTIELERQLSQRDSWKSLVSPVIGTMVIAASFATLAILQQHIEATNQAAFAKGAVAVCFIFYWAAFSSWMLLNYSYPPEILKYTQRARGVGVGQALGYLVGAGLSYAIPLAIQNLSWRYYILNCLWNVPIFVVIWWLFPETKGKTLEEIDSIFDGSAAKSSLQVIEGLPDPFIEGGHHEVKLKELKDSQVGTSAQ
ncbi:High-affinity glucose transporter [Colletotrichum fructicola]|nr:High-affinity glucose transporter [Colletotrichum fructicola]